MSDIKDGGPAFPEVFTDEKWSETHRNFQRDTYSSGGMTLRDYFAAKAMAAYIASPTTVLEPDGTPAPETLTDANIARLSYAMADAMLSARVK